MKVVEISRSGLGGDQVAREESEFFACAEDGVGRSRHGERQHPGPVRSLDDRRPHAGPVRLVPRPLRPRRRTRVPPSIPRRVPAPAHRRARPCRVSARAPSARSRPDTRPRRSRPAAPQPEHDARHRLGSRLRAPHRGTKIETDHSARYRPPPRAQRASGLRVTGLQGASRKRTEGPLPRTSAGRGAD